MKKLISLFTFVALISVMLIGCSSEQPGTTEGGETRRADISFATSGQGGTFYVAGSGIASLVSQNVEGLNVTAEVTKGVVENARLMASGQTEMGFAYGSTAYNIERGLAEFQEIKYDGLRGVSNIHDGALNIVVLQKSDIQSINDLVGKKVSIGPQGSGSASVATELLESAGLFDQIDIQYLSFDDSASGMRDGHIDSFIIGGSSPVPALIELEASHPIRILPVDGAVKEKFLEQYPYHVEYTIKGGVYSTVEQDVETVGYSVIWVANQDVPDWVVYEMLKTMYSDEGREYLKNVQASFTEMSPGIERFEKIELPLHPGAEQYYKEVGIIK